MCRKEGDGGGIRIYPPPLPLLFCTVWNCGTEKLYLFLSVCFVLTGVSLIISSKIMVILYVMIVYIQYMLWLFTDIPCYFPHLNLEFRYVFGYMCSGICLPKHLSVLSERKPFCPFSGLSFKQMAWQKEKREKFCLARNSDFINV